MKVICIDASWMKGDVPDQPALTEGNCYTVIATAKGTDDDGVLYHGFYVLAETGYSWCYQPSRFMPISDIDETELIELEQTITV